MACKNRKYISDVIKDPSEQERLNNLHQQIGDEAKETKAFRKDGDNLVTSVSSIDKINKARKFIKDTNDKYGKPVARLVKVALNKEQLVVNVLPLSRTGIQTNIAYQLPENEINYTLKSVDILQSQKGIDIFNKGIKNSWSLDKILTELQIPKEQKALILSFNTSNREEILISLLANYSYTVQIDVAKQSLSDDFNRMDNFEAKLITEDAQKSVGGNIGGYYVEFITSDGDPDVATFDTKEEAELAIKSKVTRENSQVYFNLTVPGGTNYTENEISTPLITPSIKSHAQFAGENSIGWHRSDEQELNFKLLLKNGNIKEVDC